MKHLSLFSGIGGFDLAAEWMGWENVAHCELNPFGRKILNYYWPNAISYEDITTTDFTVHRGTIDVLTGGFPCQPYSVAGLRKGKEDERHLWPEMLRAIREIKPRWIVAENVLGLVSWNGGLVFEEVQTDLEAEGYEVQPYVLPAASVDAPHKRYRVWFVAYRTDARLKGLQRKTAKCVYGFIAFTNTSSKRCEWSKSCQQPETSESEQREFGGRNCQSIAANTFGIRFRRQSNGYRKTRFFNEKSKASYWQNFPTQHPVCDGDDGISARLDAITFSKWRKESIKGGGNAVVPQLVLKIFKAIEEYEQL